MIVDQPNTIGALPIAVARSMGIDVAYLPGLAMRRAADLYPGSAKTDARDAFVIADTARTMPHTLRRVDGGEETAAELKVLVGFDEDLAAEATRLTNRIRGLFTQIHPALERVIGPRLATKQGLAVIEHFGGPQHLTKAGRARLQRVIAKANPRGAAEFTEHIWAALGEQTVTVAGTVAAEQVLPKLAAPLRDTVDQRAELAAQIEKVLDVHPLAPVLTSMPGVGVRTAARILLDVGDASGFPTPGHLAAYAGLARRRCDVLHAMLRNHEPYRTPAPHPQPLAA